MRQIQQDMTGYGRIRQDTAGYGRIRQDTAVYGRKHVLQEYLRVRVTPMQRKEKEIFHQKKVPNVTKSSTAGKLKPTN